MSLNDFRQLTNNQQIDLLYKQGVYVGKRKQKERAVVLYQLDSFYVEIFYRKYRDYITHMHFFTSTEQLQPYLKQIDVEELMKCVG